MPLDYAAIGGRLQARRKELGITQEDAAERAGITVVYLSKIENGRVHPVSYTHLTLPTNSRV